MLTKTKSPTPSSRAKPDERPPRQKESLRETLESIVFAFVLAFLFRAFEAEAFVIPTGSMAPTLYGRHKEMTCEQCGYHFVVGASDEVDDEFGYLLPDTRLLSGVCPNCRYENRSLQGELAFNGDRILVSKYPYEFGDPERWDVFVFKFPEEPKTNYIKRLVGLPNETVRIRGGDIYLVDEQGVEQIQRKPPDTQRAIQLLVHDNDYPARALIEAGWPERWAAVSPPENPASAEWRETDAGWSGPDENRAFHLSGPAATDGQQHWLRYRHFVPTPGDWTDVINGQPLDPRARLIADFCGYNAFTGEGRGYLEAQSVRQVDFGAFWVNDLTINARLVLDAVEADAEILLELNEGVSRYRCRIDPASGAAVLSEINVQIDPDEERDLAAANTGISGPGEWDLAFANVDDRLCLWVDGDLVDFGPEAAYHRDSLANAQALESDLAPAGIAVRGAAAAVSRLRLERDIYYRVEYPSGDEPQQYSVRTIREQLESLLHDPTAWSEEYDRESAVVGQRDLVLGPDEFLALGDNSPRSRDSRLWDQRSTVPRKFLVGRAFWIYWPHGVPFLNDGEGFAIRYHRQITPRGGLEKTEYPKFTVPFYPQVWRMDRIR